MLFSKINHPIFFENSVLELIFLSQIVNSCKGDQKRPNTLKKHGIEKPCSVFKIAYISNGAIVISRTRYWQKFSGISKHYYKYDFFKKFF